MTGPFFGLSLVLNLEQREYLKGGITKQVGTYLEFTKLKLKFAF